MLCGYVLWPLAYPIIMRRCVAHANINAQHNKHNSVTSRYIAYAEDVAQQLQKLILSTHCHNQMIYKLLHESTHEIKWNKNIKTKRIKSIYKSWRFSRHSCTLFSFNQTANSQAVTKMRNHHKIVYMRMCCRWLCQFYIVFFSPSFWLVFTTIAIRQTAELYTWTHKNSGIFCFTLTLYREESWWVAVTSIQAAARF